MIDIFLFTIYKFTIYDLKSLLLMSHPSLRGTKQSSIYFNTKTRRREVEFSFVFLCEDPLCTLCLNG
jgi:hypothetical protein